MSLFFLYKVILGTSLTLIYTYYYDARETADIFKYFDDSRYMTEALWHKPGDFFRMLFGVGNDSDYFTQEYYGKMMHWSRQYETQVYNDNHTIIRFNAVARLFSGGYFHVHTVFMCFLSFTGMVSFFKGFALFLPLRNQWWLALGLFLFPSLNFWSAGVLKEGLMIFALGHVFYAACLLTQKRLSWRYGLLAVFSFLVMTHLKSYALAAMCAGLVVLLAGHFTGYRKLGLTYGVLLLIGILLVIAVTYAFPNYNIPAIIAQKQGDFYRHSLHMGAGSTYYIGEIQASWGDMARMAPQALATGLLRPWPWEAHSIFMLVSAGETFLWLVALAVAIVYYKKPTLPQWNMMACCISIIVILCIVVGLSTANFGSLVRYKIPIYPFILFICACLPGNRELKS